MNYTTTMTTTTNGPWALPPSSNRIWAYEERLKLTGDMMSKLLDLEGLQPEPGPTDEEVAEAIESIRRSQES